MNNTAATAAPAFIPIIPVSAKSFFVTVCKIAPAVDNAIATNIPTKSLGSLIVNIAVF